MIPKNAKVTREWVEKNVGEIRAASLNSPRINSRALVLAERARTELGYSEKTSHYNIIMAIAAAYMRWYV